VAPVSIEVEAPLSDAVFEMVIGGIELQAGRHG
jgi:hypothetical protein